VRQLPVWQHELPLRQCLIHELPFFRDRLVIVAFPGRPFNLRDGGGLSQRLDIYALPSPSRCPRGEFDAEAGVVAIVEVDQLPHDAATP